MDFISISLSIVHEEKALVEERPFGKRIFLLSAVEALHKDILYITFAQEYLIFYISLGMDIAFMNFFMKIPLY